MSKSNRKLSIYLLISIIVLVGVTAVYYTLKTRDLEKKKEPSVQVSDNTVNESSSKVINITSFAEYNRIINEKKNTFIVFGKENCGFCKKYKPVLDKISAKYGVDVVYINMTLLNEDDYYNILNSDLTIPAKCAKEGTEIKLKNGFGTPLSLFVNQGKTYDCIRGYKDFETLEILLKTIGYII